MANYPREEIAESSGSALMLTPEQNVPNLLHLPIFTSVGHYVF